MAPNPRNYRQLRAHILATRPPICAWCGQPIDLTLSGNDPQGPSVDHILPRAQGGTNHPTNLQPMHRRCNTQRGNQPLPQHTSRNW
jgi:5-methylcytosine-specific restriction endonuclease McrA